MLPRSSSIFHLEEAQDVPLGLQILIQHQEDGSNVVIQTSVKSGKKPAAVPIGFLKACFFCKQELSLQKEIYMYRGDQGFCSVECRQKQILVDEQSGQFDSSRRERFGVSYKGEGTKLRASHGRRKISVAA
ncbi:hypothetical protein HPP92_016219 [Vanilla planifolia]|uniref:FLZ-type domain-containing protein n=1 Tax=Vanilla planifolia TaxID=51239 RepID=A0A835QBU9_VANPL|nr:hypothetical protein HPP92_016219 [Vanilla planifolia]